jgi:AcrR family transcriptional regulator
MRYMMRAVNKKRTVWYRFFMDTQTPNFRDERRARILQVAREVFYEFGYAGASMSTISARLGGSKATLYAYFSSKEELFGAIIRERCETLGRVFEAHIGADDLRKGLKDMSLQLMGVVMSDWSTRTFQLLIEESRRNPGLARLFSETMEAKGRASLQMLLKTARDRGQIDAPDIPEATKILKSLLFGDIHIKRLLGVCSDIDAADLNKHIDRAIDVFMTYYGVKDKAA